MKQIKSALLFSVMASVCIAPAVQAINMQNLKQKAKGLGWSTLSLGSVTLASYSSFSSLKFYKTAYDSDDLEDRFTLVNLGNNGLLLTSVTAYLAYKFGQKAIEAFKEKPVRQPAQIL